MTAGKSLLLAVLTTLVPPATAADNADLPEGVAIGLFADQLSSSARTSCCITASPTTGRNLSASMWVGITEGERALVASS